MSEQQGLSEERKAEIYAKYEEKPEEQKLGAVRAKMVCNSIESLTYSVHRPPSVRVKLGAIYGKEGENKDFADATPSGECWMMISAGRPAQSFFVPEKKYYVTFTEAPD